MTGWTMITYDPNVTLAAFLVGLLALRLVVVVFMAYHPARSAHDLGSTDDSAPSVFRGQSGPDGPTAARGG